MRFLEMLGRPRVAIALFVALAGVLVAENRLDFALSVPALEHATGHRYLDLCAFCSADRVMAELTGLGEHGRLWQGVLFGTVDLVIPVLSWFAGIAALAALVAPAGPASRWRRAVWILPTLALALDLTENASIIGLLLRYPDASPQLAGFEGAVSGLKFVAYAAVLAAIAAQLPMRLIRRSSSAARLAAGPASSRK